MFRYLTLYLKFLNIAVQDQLAYKPVWAIFSFLAHSAYIILSYIFLSVVINIGNLHYTKLELIAFLSFFHAVKGLYWIICSINANFIAGKAFKKGDLDFILIKPINPQWLTSVYRPNLFAFTDFLGGLAATIFFFNQLGVISHPLQLILLLITIPVSSLLLYGIWFTYLLLIAPTGEAGFTNNLLNLSWVYGQYPSSIYTGIAKIIATVLFPTLIITTIPVFTLIHKYPLALWLVVPLSAMLSFWLSRLAWQRALRLYSSAS